MDNNKNLLSIGEIREMDMVDYLSRLGYEPKKIRRNDYWYCSPLRTEKTPSFKINRRLNRWYDHGLGRGGNIIDFGILYHHCSVGDLLQKLRDDFSFQPPVLRPLKEKEHLKEESKINIIGEGILSSFALLDYFDQRHIPIKIANRFCKEIIYELKGKEYYGIGFKNDSGGFEIRNPYFKASSSPKDITTIDNRSKEANVFEGFIDFLSFMTVYKKHPSTRENFVVLNSVSFFEKARPFLAQHQTVKLYLDRDAAGEKCTRYALSLSNKFKDESHLYTCHKDFNDWLVNRGKSQKRNQGLNLK